MNARLQKNNLDRQRPATFGARNRHSTALFADECQRFLDSVIADLRQIGAWDDPASGRS
jgi:hypothetical protein